MGLLDHGERSLRLQSWEVHDGCPEIVPDENAPLPREEILRESERASENGDSLIQRNGIIARGWLKFDPFEVDLLYLESIRKKSFLERMAEGR